MTVVELMIVVVIVSGLALLTAPRFTTLSERSALRSARQQVESAIATARASAIQKGRTSTFWISGNAMGVVTVIDDAGTKSNTLPPVALDSSLGVTVSFGGSGDSAIVFSPRGFATPRLSGVAVYRFQIGSRRDSTCVSVIGHIIGQGCQQ